MQAHHAGDSQDSQTFWTDTETVSRRVLIFPGLGYHERCGLCMATVSNPTKLGDATTGSDGAGRLRLVDVGGLGGIQQKWIPHLNKLDIVMFEPQSDEAARLRAAYATHAHCRVVEQG